MRFEIDQAALNQLMTDLGRFDQKVRRRIERAAMVNFGRWAEAKVAGAVPNGNESLAKSIDFKVGRTKVRRVKNDQGKWKTIKPSATFCAVGVLSGVKVTSDSHGRQGKYSYPRFSSKANGWPLHEANLGRWYEQGHRHWRKGAKSNRRGKGWRLGLGGQSLSAPRYTLRWYQGIVPQLEKAAIEYLSQEVQAAIADSSKYTPKPRARRSR
jgi:hypothetical protein